MVDYSPAIMATTKIEVFNHLRLGGAIAEDDSRVQADVLMGWAESAYSDRAPEIAAAVAGARYEDTVADFLSEIVDAIRALQRARSPKPQDEP